MMVVSGFPGITLIKLLTNDKFNIKAFTTNQYPLSLIYRSTEPCGILSELDRVRARRKVKQFISPVIPFLHNKAKVAFSAWHKNHSF